ncbi:MAG: DnaJ domain-containing protein [Alphaproteobacteria bacterium]|nr:DnaJ domain-containing protein [Alphaproteobacteria bacterium]MBN2779618.1 DnaJ domain-containing protein [Alphaproteobacteria bacterium]
MKICDHKNCEKEGLYRAPKDRSLSGYYHFCLEHVKAYNKNWNYYAGLEGEAYDKKVEADRLGHRPSWTKIDRLTKDDLKDINDPLGLLGKMRKKTANTSPFASNSIQEKALKTMDLIWPTTYIKIKMKYKEWVKKLHPDMTGGETEEEFKTINEAFSILQNHFVKK